MKTGPLSFRRACSTKRCGRAEVLTDQETKLRLELMNGLSLEQAHAKFGHV